MSKGSGTDWSKVKVIFAVGSDSEIDVVNINESIEGDEKYHLLLNDGGKSNIPVSDIQALLKHSKEINSDTLVVYSAHGSGVKTHSSSLIEGVRNTLDQVERLLDAANSKKLVLQSCYGGLYFNDLFETLFDARGNKNTDRVSDYLLKSLEGVEVISLSGAKYSVNSLDSVDLMLEIAAVHAEAGTPLLNSFVNTFTTNAETIAYAKVVDGQLYAFKAVSPKTKEEIELFGDNHGQYFRNCSLKSLVPSEDGKSFQWVNVNEPTSSFGAHKRFSNDVYKSLLGQALGCLDQSMRLYSDKDKSGYADGMLILAHRRENLGRFKDILDAEIISDNVLMNRLFHTTLDDSDSFFSPLVQKISDRKLDLDSEFVKRTYLYHSIQERKYLKACELVEAGASVGKVSNNNVTPVELLLDIEIIAGNDGFSEVALRTLDLLLKKGANPNTIVDDKGNTALHYAVLYDKLELAQILVKNGAQIDIENNAGVTPDEMVAGQTDLSSGHAVFYVLEEMRKQLKQEAEEKKETKWQDAVVNKPESRDLRKSGERTDGKHGSGHARSGSVGNNSSWEGDVAKNKESKDLSPKK